jgi:PAS domain S-box-containing protein
MTNFKQWLDENQPWLETAWFEAVQSADPGAEGRNWPLLFRLLRRSLAGEAADASATAEAWQGWMSAPSPAQRAPLTTTLGAISTFRGLLAERLQQTTGANTVARWLVRADEQLDRVAAQAAEAWSSAVENALAEAEFLDERLLQAAQEADLAALELRATNQELIQRLKRNAAAMQQERDQLEALYALTRELTASLDLEIVMNRTLRTVSSAVGASHGSIMLMDAEKGVLVIRAILGRDRPLPPGGEATPFAPGKGLAGMVYQKQEAILVDDVLEHPMWIKSKGRGARTRSLILAPLIVDLENYGVMTIADERPGFFDQEHLRLVNTAAGQVARAISNAQLYQYISETAQELGQALRREQEEASKSQAILQSIADGVVVTDVEGHMILFNAAAERILDTRREAMIGRDVRDLFAVFEANGRQEMLEAMEALAKNPTAEQDAPRIIQSEMAMEQTIVSAHLAPVLDGRDEFVGIVTIFRDITREVQADIAKTEFVSTVSHELRTPLTSIKGYTDLLRANAVGKLTEAQQQFVEIISNNANRLAALINDLLDISRIESGRVKLEMEPLEIKEVVQNVFNMMHAQMEERGLDFRIEVPDGLPLVQADRDRLAQILTNLVGNAFRYTPEGEVSITVTKMPGTLRVDVSDTGIGISPEDQTNIWDRFFRSSHPVVQKEAGTGLGLSIVKMFVEMHGGRIWVNSEPGHGSTFTFILPTINADLPPLPQQPSRPVRSDLGKAKTVLVVEDEPDISRLIRFQLESHGYRVITAALGDEALAKAKAEQPDLITLDILLPDRDGFDVLRELKTIPRTADIPVLILSIVQDKDSGFRLGAIDFLIKPIDEHQLVQSVRRILARKAQVLIAEDDADTVGMLVQMLEKAGYSTSVAMDGYETLALARKENPGLILLDLRMPGMDGYEALTRLKQDDMARDIPIIAMSAHASDYPAEREKLLSLGAVEFLSKPFTVQELVQEIDQALEQV